MTPVDTEAARHPLARARLTLVLAALTLAALLITVPGAMRETREQGEFYLFSWRFLADLPGRLAGPGRMRFLLQPAMAIALGLRDGRADAKAGRGFRVLPALANLLLMAILLDVIFQWAILGAAYPFAALVVGPVLITIPYVLSRRLARRMTGRS
jgi:hypothetical protein